MNNSLIEHLSSNLNQVFNINDTPLKKSDLWCIKTYVNCKVVRLALETQVHLKC